MKTPLRKSIVALGVVALVALLWMFLSGPVLIKIRLNPLARQAKGTIFNPLRDRSPERAARKILQGVHSQSCSSFLQTQPIDSMRSEDICNIQASDPLVEFCDMVDSTRNKDSVWISFQCRYQRGGSSSADVSVTLSRNNLSLMNYERIY